MLNMWPPTMVGRRAQVAEGDRPDDALRLADDVVVHASSTYVAVPLRHGLELAAGVAAGAAEVALLDDPEPVAEALSALANSGGRRPCRCPAP